MKKTLRQGPLLLAAAAAALTAPASGEPLSLQAPSAAPRDLTILPGPAPAAAAPAPAPARGAPPAAPAQAAPARAASTFTEAEATVSVSVREEFTRLSFRFPSATTVTPLLQGDRLDLRFSRAADLDIAELRSSPPRFVREVRRVSQAGQPVRLALVLDLGVRQRHFVDGDRVIVDLLPPEPEPPRQAPAAQHAAAEPAQPPARPLVQGVATVSLTEEANATRIRVRWPALPRAAAFRRGEAVWLLFDAAGRIDLNGVARAGRRHQNIEVVQGEGVIGLRIPATPDVLVSARPDGAEWVFTLGPSADNREDAQVRREVGDDGRARLLADFAQGGAVRWINDPEIGDRIAVALVSGTPRGVDVRRAMVEAAILPAALGAVIEPRADGVAASFENRTLVVTRGAGMISVAPAPKAPRPPQAAPGEHAAALEQAQAPAFAAPTRALRDQMDDLTRRAAAEGVREGAPVEARMALARFLLEQELAAEALGALRLAAINQAEIVELDPEYRLMRAAANVMLGRVRDAEADLSASALANDPSAALWRGYAAAQAQDWAEARRELERGRGALEQHPPTWRARFQLAMAVAALELNDLPAAEAAASAASGQAATQGQRLYARLIEARVAGARGETERALQLYDELARVRDEEVAVRAALEGVKLRRAAGKMRAIDTVEILEALRYRWRGDALELAIVRELGDVYSEMNRWREALGAMRVAADRFPSSPAARQLRQDMGSLFERLFLDGQADQLEPIQALGLFYEFSDLTPVGANGDRIVRLLAGRLVKVDLLEQAAQLLQHQVDERLQGLGRAQVAADLAAIYLMDGKADRALVTINTSRQANMPASLLAERRILEARALLGLGRLDHAMELVERDRGAEAQSVRAEAAWRARDWPRAAADLRALLALRDQSAPMDADDRQAVLRTAIAYTLAGDDANVRQLYRDHAGDMVGTPEADSFEVVAAGVHAEGAAIRDLARVVARTDLLDRFMRNIRSRMTEGAAGSPAQPGQAPQAPQAPGAPPPSAAAAPAQQRPTGASGAPAA